MIRLAAAGLAALAAAVATSDASHAQSPPTPTPTPLASASVTDAGPLTPEAIYLRAIHAMKAAPQPAYVTFHEDVAARNMRLRCTSDGQSLELKHGDASASYAVWFRMRDENAVSRQIAAPQTRCSGALLYPTGNDIASLGVAPSAAPSNSPNPAGDAGAPPIIAAVRVESARFYKIELVDRESFEGHTVYRLSLRAYRDPNAHPLTGMLVDEDTFLVRQASGEAAGHYVIASGRVAGVVTFDRSGPYWLARDETFDLAAQAIFVHAHCTVNVRAHDFAFPDVIADDVFPSPSPSPLPKARR